MKKFLHSHPNILIGTLAVVFAALLLGFYIWAIGDVFGQIGRALTPAGAQDTTGFDLSTASSLDLQGLGDQASSSTP